ncbi:hypothetical protein Lalb_Chr15g0088781 [Lupinus albus]|uniref:Uncharacterized protein n=1 Tax=Lupinus albus TaxID=3870 RepID=A0A6A4PAD1_LUPAL|nr:hypothetical protein Lalb_Chr15g0088781 [Lupinus albus]
MTSKAINKTDFVTSIHSPNVSLSKRQTLKIFITQIHHSNSSQPLSTKMVFHPWD